MLLMKAEQIENISSKSINKQILYRVCAIIFLPCLFHSSFLFIKKKTCVTYTGIELENK